MNSRKIDIVICHWNNPESLKFTIKNFRQRHEDWVHFFVIDNSSEVENYKLADEILKNNTRNGNLIRRQNSNKEAGAYWHYLNKNFVTESPGVVLFTQEELHQYPMVPKGRISREESPFYPDQYGIDGICLDRIYKYLMKNEKDQIGFGRHIVKEKLYLDKRWRFGHWNKRWKSLRLPEYKFFSGACFAINSKMANIIIEQVKPTEEDLANEYFAWMWERMWGTIPYINGGELVHYSDFKRDIMENINLKTFLLRQLKKIKTD